MKVTVTRSREEMAVLREQAYLRAWPLPRQQEAVMDKLQGRPEKWDAMQGDFALIRSSYPYPEGA